MTHIWLGPAEKTTMRDSEHPDLFPMQERKAVDVYAHRVARNSVLSDVAAVAAVQALAGRPVDLSAVPTPDWHGEEDHAGEDEQGQERDGHEGGVPRPESR
jgi:hypothetical protein